MRDESPRFNSRPDPEDAIREMGYNPDLLTYQEQAELVDLEQLIGQHSQQTDRQADWPTPSPVRRE